MTNDEYLRSILQKYAVATGPGSPGARVAADLHPLIRAWAGDALHEVRFSGAYAKGTLVRGCTDVDLFISIKKTCTSTMREIFESLYAYFDARGYRPRRQNVSIGLVCQGVAVDLVPGHRHAGNTHDHSLYRSKLETWTKTNVHDHVAVVRESVRTEEIRVMKIWRHLQRLAFPSFYLELMAIEASRGRAFGDLANNVQTILEYVAARLPWARVVDPSNSANIVSDDLASAEKRAVAGSAEAAASARSWREVVW